MKKLSIITTIMLMSTIWSFGQKKDSSVILNIPLQEWKLLLYNINSSIDSKTKTKEIFDVFDKYAIPSWAIEQKQPADKPKEISAPKKN